MSRSFEPPLDGLTITDDFIGEETEARLVYEAFKHADGNTGNGGRFSAVRYGWDYAGLGNEPRRWMGDCPSVFYEPFVAQDGYREAFESVTVNVYKPGEGNGITPHIDALNFDDTILVLSLAVDGILKLRPPGSLVSTREKDYIGEEHCIHVPRRSLITMRGEVRRTWLHTVESAPSKDTDPRAKRVSIVYRHLRDAVPRGPRT